jgi:hypothetical protein
MAGTPITHFEPDNDRLAVLRECMTYYGKTDDTTEWPGNVISRRAAVFRNRVALWKTPRADWPEGTLTTGYVSPRLALGLTRGGSLVGLFGHVVQT